MACACKYLPSEGHFKWHPKITGPLPKGEQFTFRKWITHLWNQTNTQTAQFQQTLKCKRQLSYLKRPKSYSRRDGEAGSAYGVNTMMTATDRWWVAAKGHPRVPGERCLLGLPCFRLPNTSIARKICGKA